MGRIKQGLDYFPLSTDFMHDRIVRRVMKREGDSAFTVLIYIMSYLYSGEGYYVRAAILTSEDVQRQYLFITKRRSRHHICPDYCLLPEGKTTDEQPDTVAATGENVAVSPDIATVSRDTATKTALIKRKEKEKKENILPNPPFAKGGDEEEGSEGEKVAEGAGGGMREECDQRSATRKRNLTQEDIDRMQVPPDGCPRNFSGLLENLRLFRVPPAEQYAILLKSNYGEIGGDIWKGFSVIRGSGGKIKLPGHYLLSVLNK